MPNIIERMTDRLARTAAEFVQQVISYIPAERKQQDDVRQAYYEGKHEQPLKVKPGQYNDNLTVNFVGLAVDRANSLLFGGGVEFKYPDENDPRQTILDETWNANSKQILLHKHATDGEVWGTSYFETVPRALTYNGKQYTRLVLLKPSIMSIETDPMDGERVMAYIMEWKDPNQDIAYRKIARRIVAPDLYDEQGNVTESMPDSWMIELWKSAGSFLSRWQLMDETPWPFEFPPILHNQNLPSIHSVYGASGVDDGIAAQKKYNLVISTMLKTLRYFGSPKVWGKGLPPNDKMEKIAWGETEIIKISSENGELKTLEMQSDLASSRAIAAELKSNIFDLARVVDTQAVSQNLGQITQFNAKLLYADALAKNEIRRALYGEAYTELNRRLLAIEGFDDITPPETIWGEELPGDENANAALILNDLEKGIISKQTAAQERGYDWDGEEGEEMRIQKEKASGDGLVNKSLANFFAGRNRQQ